LRNSTNAGILQLFTILILLFSVLPLPAQVPLRTKIGQMLMVTVTGDSVEDRSPSMDTLKTDLSEGLIGGVIMFTWSGNLKNPGQIAHLTRELQKRSAVPLFISVDEEGGRVARLSASNGFASTPSAYQMGTVVNQESYTRGTGATMAGWFVQTGLNLNLAPVVDLNINPASPAIGALERSFSADPATVTQHASWFIDEFRRQKIFTALKHFPGHGSATADSHLGFTDITDTWSSIELQPYVNLLSAGMIDVVMTGHLFNAHFDSLYPATLSHATISGLLRSQIGYNGVVVTDAMGMSAISNLYTLEQAVELAVNAGVDILLYTTNLDSSGVSLARRIVNFIERRVARGAIAEARINESYARIMALKGRYLTGTSEPLAGNLPLQISLTNFPNPFNPATAIRYEIPRAGWVSLKVYDLLGREVASLIEQRQDAGRYQVQFNATGLVSGVYFCRLQTESLAATRKLILLR
jgi:beta-N-acetylhexosaminidase